MEPAASVIAKFGGNAKLARLLKVRPLWVYKWKCPPPNGTGGRIPKKHALRLLEVAQEQGIPLTLEEIWGQ